MLSASFAPTPRAMRSSAPPGANGAMSRMGFDGNGEDEGCANAVWAAHSTANASAVEFRARVMIIFRRTRMFK